MRRSRLQALLAAVVALMLSSVGALAQWSDLGLSGRQVTTLRLRHGLLYACTDLGLYRKASDTADSSWVPLGFAGQRVHDLLAVSPETLIVAREVTGTGADTVALLRSTDGGMNWDPFQNGLGAGSISIARKVVALLEPPGAPGTVLAAAWAGMNKSTDGGLTWKPVSSSGRFMFLTSGISTLWAGGESGVFTPFVKRSTNGGESWTNSYTDGSDAAALGMVGDPTDPNVAFLRLSGVDQRTVDNGVTWTPFPLQSGVAGILGAHAFPPLRLYAVGVGSGPTVFKSDDGGGSWTPISFPVAGSSLELSMLVRSGPAADTLFVGMGSGVLRYVELEVVGLDPPVRNSAFELHAHPNPFAVATTLTFTLPRAMRVSLRVLDTGGRVVATLLAGDYDAGPHRLAWSPRKFPSGIYFCRLEADGTRASSKVLIVR